MKEKVSIIKKLMEATGMMKEGKTMSDAVIITLIICITLIALVDISNNNKK